MTIYTIQVEEKHIEDGIPQCSTGCAVAKAINEKLGKIFNLDDEFSYHFESGICESGDGFNLRLADNKPFAYQTFLTVTVLTNHDTLRSFRLEEAICFIQCFIQCFILKVFIFCSIFL